MKSNLLATKLYRPALPAKWVERPTLTQRLHEGLALNRPLTLVSAPAGFGKTTCITEWLNTLDDWPVAWLSLDSADDDPGRFFAYLVAALQKIATGFGEEIETVLQSGQLPPGDAISAILINEVLEIDGRFLLVLDDFHVIRDSFILQILEDVVTNLPQPLHLVLITREDPPLPLARLRANNRLTEIRARDLRFAGADADSFLNEVMGLSLSSAETAALKEKTEGWIVGLQLAAIAMQSLLAQPEHQDVATFVQEFTGSHLYVAEYLLEEVLKQQPEEVRTFLLHTSILERLSAGLCDAVTHSQHSQTILNNLYRANIFIISLDNEGHWFRYHHLFADLLQARLPQSVSKEAVNELHLQAATWYKQNGFAAEAVRHALMAQDFERAAALVEQFGQTMIFIDQGSLKNWLDALPKELFQTHPRLEIFRVLIDLSQGKLDMQEKTLREKEALINSLPPSPVNDRLRLEAMVYLSLFLAHQNTTRAIQIAQETLAELPEDNHRLRAFLYSALYRAYGMEGNIEKSAPAYRECFRLAQAAEQIGMVSVTTMVRAFDLCQYGRLDEAARYCQAILDAGAQQKRKVFYQAGPSYIGLAGIHLERYELALAEDYLTRGLELCRQSGIDGLYTGYLQKARLHQAKGDLAGAVEEFQRLEQAFQRWDFTLTARQVSVQLALGDVESASRLADPLVAILGDTAYAQKLPLIAVEAFNLCLARIYIAQGEIEQANKLLDEIEQTAVSGQRYGRLLEIHLLRALAIQKQHDGHISSDAVAHVERALALAEPAGFVLLFLEEGPALVPLLTAVTNQPEASTQGKNYARQLLAAFDADGKPAAGKSDKLVEQLTPREMEVLQLVAAGDSNQTIADKLFITVRTVKKHITNILGKLSVSNRTQAAARARELGLLPAD